MGGPGPGHKSERARRARLANMAKARAARKTGPLRWRSGLESRVIEQLVWQWWVLEAGGSRLEVGERQGRGVARGGVEAEPQRTWRAPSVDRPRCPAASARPARLRQGYGAASKPMPRMAATGQSAYADQQLRRDKPWAKYRLARFLGVSHTWVNKLVKRFEADPERMRRRMAAFAPANLEKLERAKKRGGNGNMDGCEVRCGGGG